MRIDIVVDRRAIRSWHGRLRGRLSRLLPGAVIQMRFEEGTGTYPFAVNQLLALERSLLRRRCPALCDRTVGDAGSAVEGADAAPDVIIDLTGANEPAQPPRGTRVLRPLYDGFPGELAAVAILLSGRCPSLTLEEMDDGVLVAVALPSLEAADGLTGGMDAVLSRVIAMIEQTLSSPRRVHQRPQASPALARRGAAAFLLRNLAHQCARAIYHLCCHSPHWRIGWRVSDGPGVLETGSLAGGRWNILPDLGSDFVADPFPIVWQGQSYIFFEQFDLRAAKGVISAWKVGADGPVGEPIRVLEEPWHLSYPFLIAEKGELYMVPEASASGAVSIYRCVDFPGKWECAGQLLTGIEAADATIFRHDGRFWMTSVVRDGVGGYSDTLAIHHASHLFGPWREHAQRPALIDSRLARPAGAVRMHGGALWRPVQDCSTGYGKALRLARIDVLDPDNFSQTATALIEPGRFWPGDRLHTLNRCGGLECIDGAILTPKSKTLRRLTHGYIDRRAARDHEANGGSLKRL